jgi:hypothetical protein
MDLKTIRVTTPHGDGGVIASSTEQTSGRKGWHAPVLKQFDLELTAAGNGNVASATDGVHRRS